MSFEVRVGAISLTRLLRRDRVAGLDSPPSRVRLQPRVAGAVLDDIVLDAEDPRSGTQTIEYQVKRTMSVTAAEPVFLTSSDVAGAHLNRYLAFAIDLDEAAVFTASSFGWPTCWRPGMCRPRC